MKSKGFKNLKKKTVKWMNFKNLKKKTVKWMNNNKGIKVKTLLMDLMKIDLRLKLIIHISSTMLIKTKLLYNSLINPKSSSKTNK